MIEVYITEEQIKKTKMKKGAHWKLGRELIKRFYPHKKNPSIILDLML